MSVHAFDELPPLTRRHAWRRLLPIVAGCVLSASIGAVVFARRSYGGGVVMGSLLRSEAAVHMTFQVVNSEYPPLASLGLYGFKHVVEPYKNTTLVALGGGRGATYLWTITEDCTSGSSGVISGAKNDCPQSASEAASGVVKRSGAVVTYTYEGVSIQHVFKKAAHTYSVTVAQLDDAGKAVSAVTESVTCKYIRRDAHRMNDFDRQRTLRAMRLMFDLDGEPGRQIYGPKYVSFNEILVLHLDRYTQLKCSPWHGSTVFITSHQAMSLQIEQSLQSIDPSLSLPWMDISYEASLGKEWRESPMFSDKWFGSFSSAEDGFKVQDSIFAGVRIPTDCSKPEKNGYCRLTDAYNQDDTEVLTRADEICGMKTSGSTMTCSLLLKCLETDNYVGYLETALANVHAYLHSQFGGSWDCEYRISDVLALAPNSASLQLFLEGNVALQFGGISMVELELIKCPSDCQGKPFKECLCYCPAMHKLLEEGYSQYQASLYIVNESGLFTNSLDSVLADLPTDDAREALVIWLAGYLCTPGRLAPYSTPLGSPNDPIFMPTHAFFDAMLQAIVLRNPSFEMNWLNDEVCWAHEWLAHLPWHDFLDEHNDFYTNQDLQGFFRPDNPALPYVYDDLDFGNCKVDTPKATTASRRR